MQAPLLTTIRTPDLGDLQRVEVPTASGPSIALLGLGTRLCETVRPGDDAAAGYMEEIPEPTAYLEALPTEDLLIALRVLGAKFVFVRATAPEAVRALQSLGFFRLEACCYFLQLHSRA
jgi:hypothetical protein